MKKDEKREAKSHQKASKMDAGGLPKIIVFSDDFRDVPGLPFGCFLMTFGLPFRSIFQFFPCLFKSVKYVSGLMYFVVLDPSKSIKNRYIFVTNSIFFRDPPFY